MRRFSFHLPRLIKLTQEEKRRLAIMDDYFRLKRNKSGLRLNIRWLCQYKWLIDHATFYRLRKQYDPKNLLSIRLKKRGPKHGKTIPWQIVIQICDWKREHPEKGHLYYWNELNRGSEGAPCASGTIYNYWRDRDLIPPKKKRKPKPLREQIIASFPGELLEMDTSEKDGGAQWTIIDTFSRWKYSQWYPVPYAEITMEQTISFLEEAYSACPFRWVKIQMDNGKEFQSLVQEWLKAKNLSYQYAWTNTPEQNGHVERSFKTDLDEFYTKFSPSQHPLEEVKQQFAIWNDFYNNQRLHSAIGWQPPMELIKKEHLKCLKNT